MALKAGTGRADVSPPGSVFLWGYPHVPRQSTGIHDPLYATALCLDDGRRRTLSVAVDILFVDAALTARCRRRIESLTGTPGGSVLISATHTHSGPVTVDLLAMSGDPVLPPADPAYLALLEDGIVEAACEAVRTLQPAGLAVTAAAVDGVGGNRLDPAGPRDPELGLLAVRRAADGGLLAVQAVYSMHPTVLHEDSTLVSGDFPAFARQRIEEAFPGARVLYHTGPAGNQSPRYHVQAQTVAEAARLGGRLGDLAVDALRALPDAAFDGTPTVEARHAAVDLVPRRFPPVAEAEAALEAARRDYERLKRAGAGHGPVRTAECTVFGAEECLTLAHAAQDGRVAALQQAYRQAEVQVLRAGPLCLAALPGECFVEYGLDIKRQAPGRAFVIALANGELQGYISTPDATGYEARLSLFTPESGARMVEAAVRLMQELPAC